MNIQINAVGTDTELFLFNQENRPVSVEGKLGGTKEKPLPVPELGEGFAVQEDNVMAEYNVPPAKGRREFSDNILQMSRYIQSKMGERGLTAKAVASVRFPVEELKTKQAQTFGCDPDFCVWTRSMNEVAKDPAFANLRTAGGHIHVSFMVGEEQPGIDECMAFIRALDLFLGVPSTYLDTDTDRRRMYGKAGAFRLKPYGIEYRVLSNFWTRNEILRKWAFDGVIRAMQFLKSNNRELDRLEADSDIVRGAINNGDPQFIRYLSEQYGIPKLKISEEALASSDF